MTDSLNSRFLCLIHFWLLKCELLHPLCAVRFSQILLFTFWITFCSITDRGADWWSSKVCVSQRRRRTNALWGEMAWGNGRVKFTVEKEIETGIENSSCIIEFPLYWIIPFACPFCLFIRMNKQKQAKKPSTARLPPYFFAKFFRCCLYLLFHQLRFLSWCILFSPLPSGFHHPSHRWTCPCL